MEVVPMTSSYIPSIIYSPFFIIFAVLCAIHFYTESRRITRFGKKLPGPTPVPFFGNALMGLGVHPRDAIKKAYEYYDIYGDVIRAFLGPKLVVFLMNPEDIEVILGSPVHIDKSPEYRFFQPWLGDGLLISKGEKWRTHRKIMAPAFHQNILKTFVPLFYANSQDLVKRLRTEVGKEFDCHDHLAQLTVDILIETAMGLRGSNKSKSSFSYASAVMKMCDIIHRRTYNFLLRLDMFYQFTSFSQQQEKLLDTIHSLTSTVIRKRKEEFKEKELTAPSESKTDKGEWITPMQTDSAKAHLEKQDETVRMHYVRDDLDELEENDVGEKKRLAFLDLLLDLSRSGNKFSDEEITEEVDTIMFEGHDTTAAGSSFVLCLLGVHQKIQTRVFEELDEIFEGTDRPCTFQDTLKMKYLERVILESLRLYPPVPVIARQLNEDAKIVTDGHILPAGCTVVIPIFQIHRQSNYYADPLVFDPDNFLPEKMQSRHFYAYIPFSAGLRSCIGRKYALLKLKVMLSTILRNYKILSDLTEADFQLQADIILKRTDGFRIRIESRK